MHKSLHSRSNDALLNLLRRTRQSRRLRQADLAAHLGRSQAVVSRVESGERRLDVVELWAWLQAMDVDFLSFLEQLKSQLENPTSHVQRQSGAAGRHPGSTN